MASREVRGRCELYKRSTDAFVRWLSRESGIKGLSKQPVQTIMEAATTVTSKMPVHVALELSTAIRTRKEVAQIYRLNDKADQKADQGHEFFVQVLLHCQQLLAPAALASMHADRQGAPAKAEDEGVNMFDALHIDAPEDIGDAESASPGLQLPDGVTSSAELLGQTESFAAACFLVDVQDLISSIAKAWGEYASDPTPNNLLCATTITNTCVLNAESITVATELLHPSFNTLEHIVSAAYLSDAVSEIQDEYKVAYDRALSIVSDIAFGDPSSTLSHNVDSCSYRHVIHAVVLKLYDDDPAEERLRDDVFTQTVRHAMHMLREAGIDMSRSSNDCQAESAQLVSRVVEHTMTKLDLIGEKLEQKLMYGIHLYGDFLHGNDGILHTSGILRKVAAAGFLKTPTNWMAPKSGFFGPEWDEDMHRAEGVADLMDYLSSTLCALQVFADMELRPCRGKPRIQGLLDALSFDALMPLWRHLQEAMAREQHSVTLVISLHVFLLSLVRVNGNRRCHNLKAQTSATIVNAANHSSRNLTQLEDAHQSNHVEDIYMLNQVLQQMAERATSTPHSGGDAIPKAIRDRQRDHALLMNPWVAGQQQLVVTLAGALNFGAKVLDCHGQTRFALHLYNAMRTVAIIQPLPLLDSLIGVLTPGPALWFGGRPTANFSKAWYHAIGMGIDTEKNRKLSPILASDISAAYKRAACGDFSDVHSHGLPETLAAIQEAFRSDALIGMDLSAIGVQLLSLPDKLVAALGLDEKVKAQVSQNLVGSSSKGKRKNTKAEANHARTAAMHQLLTGEILMMCEQAVVTDEPFFTSGNKTGVPREQVGELSAENDRRLRLAASVLSDFVGAIHEDTYQLMREGKEDVASMDGALRQLLKDIALLDDQGKCVILSNASGSKFQAFDFYQHSEDSMGTPVISIQYAISKCLNRAETFLRGEIIEHLECPNKIFNAIENEVLSREYGEVPTDVVSGLRLIYSYLPTDITIKDPAKKAIMPAGVHDHEMNTAVDAGVAAASWLEGTAAAPRNGDAKRRGRGGGKQKKKKKK